MKACVFCNAIDCLRRCFQGKGVGGGVSCCLSYFYSLMWVVG